MHVCMMLLWVRKLSIYDLDYVDVDLAREQVLLQLSDLALGSCQLRF